MGEITELMLDGTLCQKCGCLIEDLIPETGKELLQPPGHPRNCEECRNK